MLPPEINMVRGAVHNYLERLNRGETNTRA